MKPRLISASIVRNETGRYLERWVEDLDSYVDEIVIMDDASDDGTTEILSSYDKVRLYKNREPLFIKSEGGVKYDLWHKIIPKHAHIGDWILTIDADEIIDPHFKERKNTILENKYANQLLFTIIECWDSEEMVRVDKTWNPAGKLVPLIVRWLPQVNYIFPPTRFHVGRAPVNQPHPLLPLDLYMVHLGYADPGEKKRKYDFYMKHDRGSMLQPHYNTFLDPNPELVPLTYFIPGGI
jgi:glycosyltransferase involved in cell wall biosynthesis